MGNELVRQRGISANALKLIAICAMLGDHIAWLFVPLYSPAGQLLHLAGRLTAPIMCWFVAEGYFHTRSVPRYAARLLTFAALSYLPFIAMETGQLPTGQSFLMLNVLYTLFCGLLALWFWDKLKPPALRIVAVIFCCILAQPGDWGEFGVLFVVAAGAFRGNFKRQAIGYAVVGTLAFASGAVPYLLIPEATASLSAFFPGELPLLLKAALSQFFQLGILLSIPLLAMYNGQKGRGGKPMKWLFYWFYPVHLILLAIFRYVVFAVK